MQRGKRDGRSTASAPVLRAAVLPHSRLFVSRIEDLAVEHGILVQGGEERAVELKLASATLVHQLLRQLVDRHRGKHRLQPKGNSD